MSSGRATGSSIGLGTGQLSSAVWVDGLVVLARCGLPDARIAHGRERPSQRERPDLVASLSKIDEGRLLVPVPRVWPLAETDPP